MTANPNQHWGGRNHTSVSRFVMSIVALHQPYTLDDVIISWIYCSCFCHAEIIAFGFRYTVWSKTSPEYSSTQSLSYRCEFRHAGNETHGLEKLIRVKKPLLCRVGDLG